MIVDRYSRHSKREQGHRHSHAVVTVGVHACSPERPQIRSHDQPIFTFYGFDATFSQLCDHAGDPVRFFSSDEPDPRNFDITLGKGCQSSQSLRGIRKISQIKNPATNSVTLNFDVILTPDNFGPELFQHISEPNISLITLAMKTNYFHSTLSYRSRSKKV